MSENSTAPQPPPPKRVPVDASIESVATDFLRAGGGVLSRDPIQAPASSPQAPPSDDAETRGQR
jgi:hypothetical protein